MSLSSYLFLYLNQNRDFNCVRRFYFPIMTRKISEGCFNANLLHSDFHVTLIGLQLSRSCARIFHFTRICRLFRINKEKFFTSFFSEGLIRSMIANGMKRNQIMGRGKFNNIQYKRLLAGRAIHLLSTLMRKIMSIPMVGLVNFVGNTRHFVHVSNGSRNINNQIPCV